MINNGDHETLCPPSPLMSSVIASMIMSGQRFLANATSALPPRSRCGCSSARGRSRMGPARTTIRGTSRNGCRCSTSAARRATGAETFPTKAQLDETDVLILHKQEAGNVEEADRKNLNEYLARGGGLVVIHAGLVSRDPDWFKTIVGGSWRNGTAKWLEGPMQLYFTDRDSPISNGASNWEMDDEIYYDLEMMPEVRILASAYTPKAAGARNANFQRRADGADGRRQEGGRLRHPAADVDVRAHRRRRPRALPRLRLDSRASLRELQPLELPDDPAARYRVGRQAGERRRARARKRSSEMPSVIPKVGRPPRRRPPRRSRCTPSST